jgi:hypothetical protein
LKQRKAFGSSGRVSSVAAARAPPPSAVHQPVSIEHRVHGADRQFLPRLRDAPAPTLAFRQHDPGLHRHREAVGVVLRAPAAVREARDAAILGALVDPVAGFPGNRELGAEGRRLFALQQAGDKSELELNPVR